MHQSVSGDVDDLATAIAEPAPTTIFRPGPSRVYTSAELLGLTGSNPLRA